MIGIDLVRSPPPPCKNKGGGDCFGVTDPAKIGWDGNKKKKGCISCTYRVNEIYKMTELIIVLLVIAILHHGNKSLFSVFTFEEEHICSALSSYLLSFL